MIYNLFKIFIKNNNNLKELFFLKSEKKTFLFHDFIY